MSEEVKVTIQGIQAQGDGEAVEVVSMGQMNMQEDGFICVSYDEVVSEEENGLVQVAKNQLKVKDRQVEVIKKTPTSSHMVFIPDQTTYTYYSTPFGEIEVSIHTNQVERTDTSNGFNLQIAYELEMNQTFISNCCVKIMVEH